MNSALAERAGLEGPAHRAAVAGDGIGRAAEDCAAPAAGQDQGVGRQGADLQGGQVLADATAAAALLVEDGAEEVPMLELVHLARHFPAPHLLVQGINQLLSGGGAGKGRPLVERAAEAAVVAKTLRSAVEGHAQAVQQVQDSRGPVGQFLDRRLVLEEIASVDGVVQVFPLAVAQLPGEVVDAVDSALGAAAMGAFHVREAHQANVALQFGQFHGRCQSGQAAADDHHPPLRHCPASFAGAAGMVDGRCMNLPSPACGRGAGGEGFREETPKSSPNSSSSASSHKMFAAGLGNGTFSIP